MPRYFPAALSIEDRECVVVGGGAVAARRAGSLLEAGARVVVVSPDAGEQIGAWARAGKLEWRRERFTAGCLDDAFLVVAATDDAEVNASVVQAARAQRVLCNDAETPERGDLIVPSAVRRGDLLLMVTAGGLSPFLSARIRGELEELYGPEYTDYVALMGEARARALESMPDVDKRCAALRALAADVDILNLIRAGHMEEARARAFSCISS